MTRCLYLFSLVVSLSGGDISWQCVTKHTKTNTNLFKISTSYSYNPLGPSVRNVFTPSDTHYLILCDVYSVDKVVDGVAELWWVRGGQIRILEVGAHYNILMCPKKDENFKSG